MERGEASMSNKVDERITRIRFDNDQFEKGVATSLQSIDRLKNKLESTESVHAFEGIQKSADKMDLSNISKAIDTISDKFSVLHQVVVDVLADIAKKAIEAGANLAKSLSVEDMMAGWQKYDQEVSAVQTIMVTLDDTPIEEIEKSLEKIGWFSDETSYSYEQMVNSMSKFISAGASLDNARDAVIGVANAAAAAGVNTKNAERAFYNFSQAMGVGYMQLIDWRSIENLNMATPEFKRNILETAAALGKIVKIGDDLYKMEGETNSDNFFTSLSMSQSLKNKWFDKDVILEVSKLYSGFANQVYEVQNAMDFDTASETMQYLEDIGEAIQDVSNKAFRAGQEAKTFSEAVGSVKDALGTKWKDTFKEIFGNYEEATKLWTRFANELYDLVATSGDTRNEILKQWNDPSTFLLPEQRLVEMFEFPELKSGRDILLDGLWNIYYSIVNVVNTIKSAWNDVFPEITAKRLYFITKRFRNFSKRILEFTENLEGVKNFLTGFFKGIKNSYSILWPVVQKSWGYLRDIFKDIWSFFKGAWDYLKPTDIYEGLINTVDGIWNLWQSFSRIGSTVIKAWKDVFPDISNWFILLTTKFKEITELILGATEDMTGFQTFVTGIFKIFKSVLNIFKSVFNFFKDISPVLKNVWNTIKSLATQIWQFFKDAWDYLKETEEFSFVISKIESGINKLKESLLSLNAGEIKLPTFEEFLNALNGLTAISGKFGKLIGSSFEWIRKKFKKFLPAEAINEVADATNNVSESAVLVLELFNSDKMASTRTQIKETGNVFVNVFSWINDNVGPALAWLKEKLQNFDLKDMLATGFLGAFSWFTFKMGTATNNISEAFGSIATAVADGVGNVLANVGTVVGGFSSLITSYTRNIKAQTVGEYIGYIKNISIAILAIVSAIYIFNKIEDPEGKINKTIMTIGLLGAGLIALVVILAAVSSKLNAYSKGVNTNFSLFNARGITITGPKSNGVISIVLGILGLVLAFKFIYDVVKDGEPEKVKSATNVIIGMAFALTACIIALQAVSAVLNKYVGSKVTISSFAPLALAGGLLMMVRAFKKINELGLENIDSILWNVIKILGVMVLVSLVLKGIDLGSGLGLLGISLAIFVFVETLKGLSKEKIDLSKNSELIAILFGILFVLGVISIIFKQGQVLEKGQKLKRVSANMISVVLGMITFVAATKILGTMEKDQLIRGALAAGLMLLGLIGMLSVLVYVSGRVGKYAGKGLIGLTILITVVTLAFTLISVVTYLNREHYDKTIATLGVLFGGLIGMLIPLIFFKSKVSSSFWVISFIILSLGALLFELYYINKQNPESMTKIVLSLSALLVSVSLMALFISKMNNAGVLLTGANTLIFIGLLLAELGLVVVLLSKYVKDNSSLINAVIAMSLIGVVISGIVAILSAISTKSDFGKTMGAVLAFSVVAAVLTGVIIAISKYSNASNLSVLKEYGKELLILSGVIVAITAILSVLGLIGPKLLLGALIGSLAFLIVVVTVVGTIVGTIWLLGIIFKNVNLDEYIKMFEKLSIIMFLIGNAIGSFFAGMTHGYNKAKIVSATDGIQALVPLAEAMIPLGDTLSEIPSDFDEKAIAFKKGIKELKGVSGEFNNTESFSSMLTALDDLAPKFRSIAEKVKESDFGNLKNLEGAIEAIRNINQWTYSIKNEEVSAVIDKFAPIVDNISSLSNSKLKTAITNVPKIKKVLEPLGSLFDTFGSIGIKGNIFTGKYVDGSNDVINAIESFSSLIDNISSLSNSKLKIAITNVPKIKKVLEPLGSLFDTVGSIGIKGNIFTGKYVDGFNDVINAIESLSSSSLIDNLSSFLPKDLDRAINNSTRLSKVLDVFSKIIDKIPQTGGVAGWLAGEEVETLDKLPDLMEKVLRPAKHISVFNPSTLDKAAENSEKLALVITSFGTILDSLPKTGGLSEFFSGEESNTFDKLPEFADAIIRYGRQLMATENIQPVKSAIGVTSDLATSFEGFMNKDMPAKLRDVAAAIGELSAAGVDKVSTFFTDDRAIAATSDAITNLTENFRNEINKELKNNRIIQSMQILYAVILNNVRYQALNFYLSGKLLHDEFIRGVEGETFDAAAAGIALTKGLTTATKDSLQEKSPSALMFGYGEYAGLGLALGVESKVEEVESAGEILGASVGRGVANGMSNFMNSKQYAKAMGSALINPKVTKLYEDGLGDKIKNLIGNVLGENGEELSLDQLVDEFIVKPFSNKKNQLMSVIGDVTLDDVKNGSWKTKLGDALQNTLTGSMDRSVIGNTVGEAVTTGILDSISKATGLTNVHEVVNDLFTPQVEESWIDQLANPDNLFDWNGWLNSLKDDYLSFSSTVSDNPIQSIFSDDYETYALPTSYDYQSLARSATGGGTVAGYTSEDVQALTREIYGLEEALYSLKETMKDQHMVHSGEISVRYTNEADFIDRVQTTIINSVRREARG